MKFIPMDLFLLGDVASSRFFIGPVFSVTAQGLPSDSSGAMCAHVHACVRACICVCVYVFVPVLAL